jgi:Holliday junction resolvasome RuvABC endonuclease subunit
MTSATSATTTPAKQVMGLDLSLVQTGIAVPGQVGTLKTPGTKVSGMARLYAIREQIIKSVSALGVGLVMVEGYSYGSKNGGERLGELGGVIRFALWSEGVPYVEVPPSTLKMYASGKGNAGKVEVLVAARDRLGYTGTNDNEADALWLWALGMELIGHPVVTLPKTHTRALGKLEVDVASLKEAVGA